MCRKRAAASWIALTTLGWPRAGRGPGALVHVADARLDLVEEPLDLLRLLGENPRREPVLRLVRLGDRLVQPGHLAHRDQRHEQLLQKERARERQLGDRWSDEVATVEAPARESLPTQQDRPLAPGLGNRPLEFLYGVGVDHRSVKDIARGRIAHFHRARLLEQP